MDDADFGEVSDLPLFAFLQPEQIGAWPLLTLPPSPPEASTTTTTATQEGNGNGRQQEHQQASLEHLIGTLAAFQVHSFVDIYVTQDERNSSQYILQVKMPSIAIHSARRLAFNCLNI